MRVTVLHAITRNVLGEVLLFAPPFVGDVIFPPDLPGEQYRVTQREGAFRFNPPEEAREGVWPISRILVVPAAGGAAPSGAAAPAYSPTEARLLALTAHVQEINGMLTRWHPTVNLEVDEVLLQMIKDHYSAGWTVEAGPLDALGRRPLTFIPNEK